MDDGALISIFLKEILPSAGVGGMMAAVMFYFVRRDRIDSDARFAEIVRRQDVREAALIEVVTDNIASATKLAVVIEGLQRAIDTRNNNDGQFYRRRPNQQP